ncbi:MAG: CBS domain-containing protein [Desulfobacteraceae bacterium]|jgi:CBS domain-containing protein
MVKAKDIMSATVTTVHEYANVMEVIKLLVEHNVTGLPVVDDSGRLLGMVTEKDILMLLLYDPNVKGKTVTDLMTTEIIHFDEDENLMTIFESLVQRNFRRVPILSEGRLVGIVSRRDIIKFLSAKARKAQKNDEDES